MYAYFVDISQGSVEMHLWSGGIFNNHVIANCLQSMPVKEFWKSIKISEDIDKSKVPRFLAHPVYAWKQCVELPVPVSTVSSGAVRVIFLMALVYVLIF